MLGHSIRLGKIAGIISVVGIVAAPMDWVPLIAAGGLVLEIPNVVSALFAAILPFAILASRRMWRINLFFGLMLLWTVLYVSAMMLHGTPDGIPIGRQQLMQCLFGWTLALSLAHSDIRISRIGLWALIGLGSILVLSAAIVGLNLLEETLHYLLTGDRGRFVYKFLRPMFNAFVSGGSDVDYVASEMNNLANGIALFAALVFFPDSKEPRGFFAPDKMFAFAFLGFAFVIFSTSANLVILVFLMAMMVQVMTRASMLLRLTLPLGVIVAGIVISGPIMSFVEGNLLEDSNSRGARVGQYEDAIHLISDNMLSGVGYFEFGGNPVHNWPLFSWATAGYLPFLIVVLVYIGLALSGVTTLRLLKNSGLVLLPVMTLFLVRTLVGGGGGIPNGSAIVAASIVMGLLERYHRVERQMSAAPALDPHQARTTGRLPISQLITGRSPSQRIVRA